MYFRQVTAVAVQAGIVASAATGTDFQESLLVNRQAGCDGPNEGAGDGNIGCLDGWCWVTCTTDVDKTSGWCWAYQQGGLGEAYECESSMDCLVAGQQDPVVLLSCKNSADPNTPVGDECGC